MIQTNCWMKDSCNQVDCGGFCPKFHKLDQLYNLSLIPDTLRRHIKLYLDKDKCDEAAFNKLKSIMQNSTTFINSGSNLFLFSENCGNGKTSWVLKIVESYLNKNWIKSALDCKVLFISVPRYLLEIKSNITEKSKYVEHINKYIYSADLVIFDDIGTKQSTDWEREHLFTIIDDRLNRKKSCFYTSNLSENDLFSCFGERLYSRIINNSICIKLVGLDKRALNK